ncbi:MAG: hypothetical protein ACI9Y1_000680 [Lentisphaeria bacterium]|jgi:hypothetical protein
MNMGIDVKAASIEAVAAAIGANLKAQIRHQGSMKSFRDDTGIANTTLYRLEQGEEVSWHIVIRALKGLGMEHVLEELLVPPSESPIERWNSQGKVSAQTSRLVSRALDPHIEAPAQSVAKAVKKAKIGSRHAQ